MIVVCPEVLVTPGSPPTSYAIAGSLNGERGANFQVVKGMLTRTLVMMPGMALAGIRGKELLLGSLLGSVGISASLFALYLGRRNEIVSDWTEGRQGRYRG
jgi:hypothetical protein